MLTFVTDICSPSEPDILQPVLFEDLVITNHDGEEIARRRPPAGGWSHVLLTELAEELDSLTRDGAEAAIGGVWVGSTEV